MTAVTDRIISKNLDKTFKISRNVDNRIYQYMIVNGTRHFYLFLSIHIHESFKLILFERLSFSFKEFKSDLRMYSIRAILQNMKYSSFESLVSRDAYHSQLPSRWLLDFSGEPDSRHTWKTADPSRLTFEIGVNRPSCRNARPWRNNDDCSFLVNQGNSFRPQCIWSRYLVRPSRESSLSYFSLSHSPSSALRKNALTDPRNSYWPKPGSNSILVGLRMVRCSIAQRSDGPFRREREMK